jgi:hypothetical protein
MAQLARSIHLLVGRVDIGASGADVRLKLEGLANLARVNPSWMMVRR